MSVMVYVYGHRSHSACSRGVPSYVWWTWEVDYFWLFTCPSSLRVRALSRSAAAPRRKKCVVNTWKHVEGRKVRYDKIRYKINTYAVAWLVWCVTTWPSLSTWLVWCCYHLNFSVNLLVLLATKHQTNALQPSYFPSFLSTTTNLSIHSASSIQHPASAWYYIQQLLGTSILVLTSI